MSKREIRINGSNNRLAGVGRAGAQAMADFADALRKLGISTRELNPPHRRVATDWQGNITVSEAPKPVAPVWAFARGGYVDTPKPDTWERENQAAMIEAVKARGKE